MNNLPILPPTHHLPHPSLAPTWEMELSQSVLIVNTFAFGKQTKVMVPFYFSLLDEISLWKNKLKCEALANIAIYVWCKDCVV